MKLHPTHALHSLLWLTLLLLVAGNGCGKNDGDAVVPRPVAVRTAALIVRDLDDKLTYVGTVRAAQEILVTAQVPGTVLSLPVPEGAAVEPGDVIVQLYTPELEANVKRLRADRDYWDDRHRSDERLVAVGALPQEQAAASLRASTNASAALAEASARLAKRTETASIKGTVLSVLVEPGQHVMPAQPLLLLGSDGLEIHTEVVEEDLRRGIQLGNSMIVRALHDQVFESVVSDIAPVATGPSRTFTTKTRVPAGSAAGLRVGESVRVEFTFASCDSCLAVPVEAIQRDSAGSPYVYLIRDGRALKQPVRTGLEADGLTEVSMPWNGDDQVAITNLRGLADGIPVFPVANGARPQ